MLLSSKRKVDETIVRLLAEGPVDSLVLLQKAQEEITVTKQGFYRALRELLKDEVVTKHKQTVLLNTVWLNKLQNFVTDVDTNYLAKASEQVFSLSEGDSMTFKFKSVLDLDMLWMHYFYMLAKQSDTPILFNSHHEFWSLFRSDMQSQMYAWIKANNKKTYYVIGSKTLMDIETTKPHKQYGLEIAYEDKPSTNPNTGITVMGDYIFNTVLDNTTTKAIDELYRKYQKWEPAVEKELQEIIGRIRRSKVVIERNHKKAELLRKKLMKYFVFYK